MKLFKNPKTTICLSLLALFASLNISSAAQTRVKMETDYGDFYLLLYDDLAPLNVANFLSYVESDAYDGTFFHRSIPGFILQGGGFEYAGAGVSAVVPGSPVANEFGVAGLSNTRGTISMAQAGTDPDSATSGWFINLVDNDGTATPNNLDTLNGGFTVFGIIENMDVVDSIIADTDIFNVGGDPFANLPVKPLDHPDSSGLEDGITASDVVTIQNVSVVPEPSSSALVLLGVGTCLLIRRRK